MPDGECNENVDASYPNAIRTVDRPTRYDDRRRRQPKPANTPLRANWVRQ
jgi:hypothetical protein